jgi:hypothetical protein
MIGLSFVPRAGFLGPQAVNAMVAMSNNDKTTQIFFICFSSWVWNGEGSSIPSRRPDNSSESAQKQELSRLIPV